MRIGFATPLDATSRLTWSGTPSFMADALTRHGAEVVHLGPMSPALSKPMRLAGRLSSRFLGQRIADRHVIPLARAYGRMLSARVAAARPDVIFAPAGAQLLAYADLPVPVVYASDATFAAMVDYYPEFTNLHALSKRHGNTIERRAIARADILTYPSDWAAQSAIRDYGADPARVRVIPYGANLEQDPAPVEPGVRTLRADRCRLLFIGTNWQRKGGPTAVATLVALRQMGIDASLTVCGCVPPADQQVPGVRVEGFLDKTDPEDAARLGQLYRSHDIFLFPSRHEAYGIVVAEASAHGLPTLASETGGVAGVLHHGENGLLLPADASGARYAAEVAALLDAPKHYRELAGKARRLYETALNWDTWSDHLLSVMARQVTLIEAAGKTRSKRLA
jgi:glycosyltransferase involved in cell wall biosynthesis